MRKPHPFGTFTVFSAIFFVAFLPSFLFSFGLLDDYFILDRTLTKGAWCPEIVGNMMCQGRPLNLPFIAAAFSPLKKIDDLVYLRVAATIGIALLATLFFRHSMHVGWNRTQSFLLSLIAFTQIPFQVLASWSLVGFLGGIRIPLAYVSYFLTKYAAEKPFRSPAFLGFYVAALATLTASMAMHQTAAMFFWIGMAQEALSPKGWQTSRRQMAVSISVFGTACVLELLISTIGKNHFAEFLIQDRKELAFKPLEKIVWFLNEPMVSCLNFNNLNASTPFALGMAIFIAVGLWFFIKRLEPKEWLKQRILLLIMLPFFCYIPNFVIAESWASYRTLYALSTLMILYFFCAIQGMASRLSISSKAVSFTLLLTALLNLFCANQNIATYIAMPQAKELDLLRYRLQSQKTASAATHLGEQLQPPKDKGPFDMWPHDSKMPLAGWSESLAPAAFYDEFGRPSSSRPFIGKAMIDLIERERRVK